MVRCSVIIATKNRLTFLKKCLSHIDVYDSNDFEIIVVDTSDNDDVAEYIQKDLGHLKIKYIHTRFLNVTKSRNLGIANSKGELVIFLDDDIYLTKGSLLAMLNFYEKQDSKNIIIQGGIYDYRSQKYQIPGRVDIFGWPRDCKDQNYNWASTAFLAVPRWILNKIRFDEKILWGYEDVDFCLRAKVLLKSKILYFPQAFGMHRSSFNLQGPCASVMKYRIYSVLRYHHLRGDFIKMLIFACLSPLAIHISFLRKFDFKNLMRSFALYKGYFMYLSYLLERPSINIAS